MTDTPPPSQDRPLVTFALFAYNQEKYIREAIEGAFSQKYEPLEIILSDDCSSDRTYEIMQEMAAAYKGPHEVRVRQETRNVGTLQHILNVSRTASGAIIVVAAGDDISLQHRTTRLASLFDDPDVVAGSSDDHIIDDRGTPVAPDEERIAKRDTWHRDNPTWLHGATSAYRKNFLKQLPDSDVKLLYEDQIFSDIMKGICSRSFRIKDKLIKYRHHTENLSSRHKKYIYEAELAAIKRWQRMSEAKNYCIRALEGMNIPSEYNKRTLSRLCVERRFFYLLANWRELGFLDKMVLLYMSISARQFKAVLIRSFGCSFFDRIHELRAHIKFK